MPLEASHFSMVGFSIDLHDGASMQSSMEPFLSKCAITSLSAVDSVCVVKDASGGELWVSLRKTADGKTELVTMNPAFNGNGRMVVDVDADVSDPSYKPFEVAISAHFHGDRTPIVLDLADPTEAPAWKPGSQMTIDVTAFSFAPEVFPDEAAYYASQNASGSNIRFASTFFVPTGSFYEKVGGALPDGATRPIAYAEFAGKVLKSEFRKNTEGGQSFWWAEVSTYDSATFDVVMDPTTIHRDPVIGSIVAGRFWLSARLAPSN